MVKANEPPREWISWGQSTRVLPSLKRIGPFRVHIIQYRWTVSYTFSSCARLQLTKFFSSKSGLSFSEFGHSHEELKTCGMIRTFRGNPIDFVAPNFETHCWHPWRSEMEQKLQSYDIWEVCHGNFEAAPGIGVVVGVPEETSRGIPVRGHQFGMRKNIENKNTGQWIGEIHNVYVHNVHIYCNGCSSKLVLEWRVSTCFNFGAGCHTFRLWEIQKFEEVQQYSLGRLCIWMNTLTCDIIHDLQ